jgi:hypothetical protein
MVLKLFIMDRFRDVGQLALSTLRWPSCLARLPGPEFDPYHVLSDDADVKPLFNDSYDTGAISDESVDLGYLERLRAQRLRRKSAAFTYSGDLLKAVKTYMILNQINCDLCRPQSASDAGWQSFACLKGYLKRCSLGWLHGCQPSSP